jgi:hypothetical protein
MTRQRSLSGGIRLPIPIRRPSLRTEHLLNRRLVRARIPPPYISRPPADTFVLRIKAGTVARKGRGSWLVWGLALRVAFAIWFIAQPWFTSSRQSAADQVRDFLANGGEALLGSSHMCCSV